MKFIFKKPEWVDIIDDGEVECEQCPYKTNSQKNFEKHIEYLHNPEREFILYFECLGSIEARNALADYIDFQYIDMTGGQAAFEDGDLQEFGKQLVDACNETGHKLRGVYRIHDPGLGLMVSDYLINHGLMCGVYEKYELPEAVIAHETENAQEIFIIKE